MNADPITMLDGQEWRIVGSGTQPIDRSSVAIERWRTECPSCHSPFEVWTKGRRVGERRIVHWCERRSARALQITRPLFDDEMGVFRPDALDS